MPYRLATAQYIKLIKQPHKADNLCGCGDPSEIRTPDTLIKSLIVKILLVAVRHRQLPIIGGCSLLVVVRHRRLPIVGLFTYRTVVKDLCFLISIKTMLYTYC